MSASDWTMQFLADILAAPVDRPSCLETTALGAAYLAGMAAGPVSGYRDLRGGLARRTALRAGDGGGRSGTKYRGWQDAVARTLLRP